MEYIKKKKASATFIDAGDLEAIESASPEGMTSGEIIKVFEERGIRFSEATFRKYVQLGLLPRSRRVGSKGKHKGSRGIYPVGTVRQINEIKRMMALDYTIEEIGQQFAFVGGELEELRRLVERILEKLEQGLAAEERGGLVSTGVRRQIEEARGAADELVEKLSSAARKIREQVKLAREAV